MAGAGLRAVSGCSVLKLLHVHFLELVDGLAGVDDFVEVDDLVEVDFEQTEVVSSLMIGVYG